MAAFTKRHYERFGQFWTDLVYLWKNRRTVRGVLRGKSLDNAFRERLMLAVTAVNRCRYCSFVHTRMALRAGVTREELDKLFSGDFDALPDHERVALLYAQHWADTHGRPDPEAEARLSESYPPETVEAILVTIRFINFNNLFGNTTDWVLHTLSFGLLGAGK